MDSKKGLKMTKQEQMMYGMSVANIHKEYMESLTAKRTGLEMVAMGVLSDAQELMQFGGEHAIDQVRKDINIAKYILSEMMEMRIDRKHKAQRQEREQAEYILALAIW